MQTITTVRDHKPERASVEAGMTGRVTRSDKGQVKKRKEKD